MEPILISLGSLFLGYLVGRDRRLVDLSLKSIQKTLEELQRIDFIKGVPHLFSKKHSVVILDSKDAFLPDPEEEPDKFKNNFS